MVHSISKPAVLVFRDLGDNVELLAAITSGSLPDDYLDTIRGISNRYDLPPVNVSSYFITVAITCPPQSSNGRYFL
jgi:hypothetical protein